MTVGEKIRKYRVTQNLSQRQLALMSGMSEPAIRNYELGNRNPSKIQLKKIADALGISILALSDPDLDSYYGVMHALFNLEDTYGLTPQEIEEKVYLSMPNSSTLYSDIKKWNEEFTKLKSGDITQEEYDLWRHSYPRIEAERTQEEMKKNRTKDIPSDK